MNRAMTYLLPCPFCGGEATARCGEFAWLSQWAECKQCGAQSGEGSSPEEKWNKRTPLTIDGEIDSLGHHIAKMAGTEIRGKKQRG